jgi:uncharacterized membrane protein YkvA (DUF1232 family)
VLYALAVSEFATAREPTKRTLDTDMSHLHWLLLVAACVLLVYAGLVVALIVVGRRRSAGDVVRFIPDCIVLVKRLLSDPRVPRRHKVLLGVLVGYLALPFDLVPDFIPVAGQVDDALVVILALRVMVRGSGTELLREHWRGSESSLGFVLRFAGARSNGRVANAAAEGCPRLDRDRS